MNRRPLVIFLAPRRAAAAGCCLLQPERRCSSEGGLTCPTSWGPLQTPFLSGCSELHRHRLREHHHNSASCAVGLADTHTCAHSESLRVRTRFAFPLSINVIKTQLFAENTNSFASSFAAALEYRASRPSPAWGDGVYRQHRQLPVVSRGFCLHF